MNAVILAGGEGKRLGGVKKALLTISENQRLIDAVVGRIRESGVFDEILIVGDETLSVQGARSFGDDEALSGCGVVGGLLTALRISSAEWNFVCGCDMPFIEPALIRLLVEFTGDDVDAVVPRWGDYIEPLCAFYRKRLIESGEALRRYRRLSAVIEELNVRFVEESALRKVDAELISFFNINTEDDIRRARELCAEGDIRFYGG